MFAEAGQVDRVDDLRMLDPPAAVALVRLAEFVDRVDLDFSTVSQHLSGLKVAGVVEADKRGKEVFYRLKCSCVRSFLRCVEAKRRTGAC